MPAVTVAKVTVLEMTVVERAPGRAAVSLPRRTLAAIYGLPRLGLAISMSEKPRTPVRRWAVPAIGVGLLAGLLVRCSYFHGGVIRALTHNPLESIIPASFGVFVVFGGIWLLRHSGLPAANYGRIVGWCIGGLVCIGGIVAVLLLVKEALGLDDFLYYVHFAGSTGASMGLLVGIMEATAIEHARTAERTVTRATRRQEERARLDYLNNVLRHEVLNTAHIITGHAEQALADDEAPVEDHLRTIRRQGENMTSVITDVRVLTESLENDEGFDELNLSTVVAEEVANLRDTHPETDVETSIPGDVFVPADDLVRRVFSNLLVNAVRHNESSHPRVEVSVEPQDASARVRIADNGPGIPEHELATLFERGPRGNDGLGLHVVHALVERYDGQVELTETGPAGSTFTVELPTDTGHAPPGDPVAGVPDSSATESLPPLMSEPRKASE